MTDENILEILRPDLQISVDVYDAYLMDMIHLARESIADEGIILSTESDRDGMLIELYAAYLYRSRKDGKADMPRMLRCMLNNRLIQQKAGNR